MLSNKEIRSEVIHYTCATNCYGKRGNASACCKMGERDFILGPMRDAIEFMKRLNARSEKKFKYDDVFIEYKEGSQLFREKESWQNPKHFPALRMQMYEDEKPCVFLDEQNQCSVYDIRPNTCRNYMCDHLQKVVDLL